MNIEEENIKKWLHEAGREEPGMGFSNRVLAALEKAPSGAFQYRPLISPLGIRIIIGSLAAIFLAAIFLPGGGSSGTPGEYALFQEQLHSWLSSISTGSHVTMPDWQLPFAGTGTVLGWSLLALAVMMVLTGYIQNHARHT